MLTDWVCAVCASSNSIRIWEKWFAENDDNGNKYLILLSHNVSKISAKAMQFELPCGRFRFDWNGIRTFVLWLPYQWWSPSFRNGINFYFIIQFFFVIKNLNVLRITFVCTIRRNEKWKDPLNNKKKHPTKKPLQPDCIEFLLQINTFSSRQDKKNGS